MPNVLVSSRQVDSVTIQSTRLHYLDWLRVIAILIVFLFHAVHPFDLTDWHVKNPEQSLALTIILVLLSLWGMPFFFLVAGAGSWFALQRRTPGQYASERFKRLFIPFLCGSILFSPIILFCEWGNRTQFWGLSGSFDDYVISIYQYYLGLGIDPRWVGIGYHLWFVGFLFAFALITLPFFLWLKGKAGRDLVSKLASWSSHRGGLLLFILPLLVVQIALRPFALEQHGWADFVYQMSFFVLGYLLYADQRFTRALRRDWGLFFGLGTLVVLGLLAMYAMGFPIMTWAETPALPQFYLALAMIVTIALCYCLTMLFIGMRLLDFTNRWLEYAQQAVLPFYVVHQPVILVIAFFVVRWNADLLIKLPAVVLSSFVVSVGLYELVIRRIRPLHVVLGVKGTGRAAPAETGRVLSPRPG